ncbi:mechanosensitive ion channel family protein [Arcanobacterium hippocoleae]|uniref:mechanosensitive ion channel family protein n=1 Tax=Arcanobacterium hippocoleae TaxID=149017 RepID=UPI0033410002
MNTDNAAKEAVETTFDLLQLILSIGLGIVVGITVGLVTVAIGRFMGRQRPFVKPFFEACSRPVMALCVVLGATFGFWILEGMKDAANPRWFSVVDHLFLIFMIVSGTWLVVGMINGAVELIHNRMLESSERRAARVRTQTQILHRVVVVVIWVLGIAGVLLTFPSARTAGASLLASAGLVSVVAGLAAQTTLGNVFAGLQLAFSDSIRVGDIVQYKGNYTTVEEITLTYVVLAVWDGRRIIVPSSLMTTEDFENWTRRKPDMIGEVTWEVDWSVPIEAARKQFQFLLSETDLWDGNTGVLSIKEAQAHALTLRAVVSAADSAMLTDLKFYLREKMVLWIQQEAPQAIPHLHYSEYGPIDISQTQKATQKMLEQRLDRLIPSGGSELAASVGEQEQENHILETLDVAVESDPTAVFTVKDLRQLGILTGQDQDRKAPQDPQRQVKIQDPVHENPGKNEYREGHESSLFSGSPQAEERKREFSGPGEDVYEERNRKIAQTNATGELTPINATHGSAAPETKIGQLESAGAQGDTSDDTSCRTTNNTADGKRYLLRA